MELFKIRFLIIFCMFFSKAMDKMETTENAKEFIFQLKEPKKNDGTLIVHELVVSKKTGEKEFISYIYDENDKEEFITPGHAQLTLLKYYNLNKEVKSKL